MSRELACKHGSVLGVRPGQSYKEEMVELECGQTLVLYTDGVTEALSPQDELFGPDRFIELLCSYDTLDLAKMCNNNYKDLEEFQQGNLFNDITVLALKREVSNLKSDDEEFF